MPAAAKITNATPIIHAVHAAPAAAAKPPSHGAKKTTTPITICVHSAALDETVPAAHKPAAMAKIPSVTNQPAGAPAVQIGASAKYAPSATLTQSCHGVHGRTAPPVVGAVAFALIGSGESVRVTRTSFLCVLKACTSFFPDVVKLSSWPPSPG